MPIAMLAQIRRITVPLLVALSSSVLGYPQQPAPKFLNQAIYCLTTKDFLEATKRPSMVGYFLTTKWYPGDKALYVVVYSNVHRSAGSVFTIFLSAGDDHPVFNIQNNGKFVRSSQANGAFKKEDVDFVEDPLGGIWTQEHLAMAIQEIGRRKALEIRTSELLAGPDLPRCESYAESK
jgi:hypothetical protein